MKTLISFTFTDDSWAFTYEEDSVIMEQTFYLISEAEEFNILAEFGLNLYGCPI